MGGGGGLSRLLVVEAREELKRRRRGVLGAALLRGQLFLLLGAVTYDRELLGFGARIH